MTLFKISIQIYTMLLMLSIGVSFGVKYNVGDLHAQLNNSNIEITKIKNTIQVLEAEWSYLTQPARLEKLAEKHLNLQPILYSQVSSSLDTEYSALASAD